MKLFAAARRMFRILLVVIRYRLDDIRQARHQDFGAGLPGGSPST